MPRLVTADFANNTAPCVLRYTNTNNTKIALTRNSFDRAIYSHTYQYERSKFKPLIQNCGKGCIIFKKPISIIKACAFKNNRYLTEISIPNSVTTIEDEAFRYCTSLTSILIPHNVTSIGYNIFLGCGNLSAFYGKFASEDHRCLIINGELREFACNKLTEYYIPDGVTKIGNQAFYYCGLLTSITIPNSVTEIGNGVFRYCRSLESITIPDSVTKIGDGAFEHNDNLSAFYGKFASSDNRSLIIEGKLCYFAHQGLTEYTIPEGVTSIGNNAFQDCSYLQSINIPDSTTLIGDRVFNNCRCLKTINCRATTPPKLGEGVFNGIPEDAVFVITEGCEEAYMNSDWSKYLK